MAKATAYILKPGQKVADWDACYDQYLALKRTQTITQAEYALQVGVDKAYLSTNFAEIRRKRAELDVRNRLPLVMAQSLAQVQEALKLNGDSKQEGIDHKHIQHYALDAFKAIADRAGFSPQAVTVQVSQTNQQAVMMPPIFAQSYAEQAEKMLKGANGTPEAND